MGTRVSVATDNFNRASPLGANWAQLNNAGVGDVDITASTLIFCAVAGAGATDSAVARWVGAGTFTDDQYSKVTIKALQNLAVGYSMGVCARASADTGANRDYYAARVLNDSAGPTYTTRLEKVVNGTVTTLNSAAQTWAVNDTISIECEGQTIRLCRNDVPLGGAFTATDATIATGQPGVACSGDNTVTGDDWDGGKIIVKLADSRTTTDLTFTGFPRELIEDDTDGGSTLAADVKEWW